MASASRALPSASLARASASRSRGSDALGSGAGDVVWSAIRGIRWVSTAESSEMVRSLRGSGRAVPVSAGAALPVGDGLGAKGDGLDTGCCGSDAEATIGEGGCVVTGDVCAVTGTAREVRGAGSFFSSPLEVFNASVAGVCDESCSAASFARAERFPSTHPRNNAKPTHTTRIAASSMASRRYPFMIYLSPRCTNVTRRFAAWPSGVEFDSAGSVSAFPTATS